MHILSLLKDNMKQACSTVLSCSVMSDSLQPHGPHSKWNSPGQNIGVGSLSLLQGIFPIQGSNPGLPHCRGILYQLSHQGSPRILEWVAYPFSSGSSQPRNWTGVSCIAGGFFTNWAIRDPRGNQPCISIGSADADAEAEVPADAKSPLIGKDPDAGKDWRQEEKGITEDVIVGWCHWLSGHEFEQSPGNDEGQGNLACCSPWGCNESVVTEWTATVRKPFWLLWGDTSL